MCTDFKMLEVKVPIIFPVHRVFRYAGMDVRVTTL
jgi:hypothetical protein